MISFTIGKFDDVIISTNACYAVYVNTMCEIRQKTTKTQSAALHFFENVTDQKKV